MIDERPTVHPTSGALAVLATPSADTADTSEGSSRALVVSGAVGCSAAAAGESLPSEALAIRSSDCLVDGTATAELSSPSQALVACSSDGLMDDASAAGESSPSQALVVRSGDDELGDGTVAARPMDSSDVVSALVTITASLVKLPLLCTIR